MTVEEALSAAGLPSVDCIVTDVEGHESVLLRSIEFARHNVKFLMYEHKHLGDDDREGIKALIRTAGFEVKEFGRDTVAWCKRR